MNLSQRLLPPNNPRTTCPPGRLSPGKGPLIVVASLERSGTHLLIDAILNNFSQYKRRPLYVNFDHILHDPARIEQLICCKGYVVKTHFPQSYPSPEREQMARTVLSHALILSPIRDLEQVYSSSLVFGTPPDRSEFDRAVDSFNRFWAPFEVHRIPFSQLLDRTSYAQLIDDIARWTNLARNRHIIYPPDKRNRIFVYLVKSSTRLLGSKSPLINTTIGFAKAPRAAHQPS